MKIRSYILIVISLTALVILAACSRDSIKDIEASIIEVENLHGQAVNEVNRLYEEESKLQNLFKETLDTDETLSSLKKGSSAIFDNIETREAGLITIEEIEDQMMDHADTFTTYEGKLVSEDELESVSIEVENLVSSLNSFRQKYRQRLITQEQYFVTIGTEEANYDTFVDGIEKINKEFQEMQEVLILLDNRLVDLQEVIITFQGKIEDI